MSSTMRLQLLIQLRSFLEKFPKQFFSCGEDLKKGTIAARLDEYNGDEFWCDASDIKDIIYDNTNETLHIHINGRPQYKRTMDRESALMTIQQWRVVRMKLKEDEIRISAIRQYSQAIIHESALQELETFRTCQVNNKEGEDITLDP